jgi:ABC-2 type transport system permease protein
MIKTAFAFIKRDFLLAISYKAMFVIQFLSIFFGVTVLYYVGEVFGNVASLVLNPYGGNYFTFLLLGIAFLDYHAVSLRVFSNSIQESQMMGTLEIILLSPINLSAMLWYSSLWGYIFTSLRFLVYLLLGVLLFGLNIGNANILTTFLILTLSIVSFASMGVFLAGIVMFFKRGDSINVILSSVSMFLGGVPYPIEVLPDWIRHFSNFLPLTHALNGMRMAIIRGYSPYQVLPEIAFLIIFSLIFFPLGTLFFKFTVQRAKINGTLTHY